MHARTLAVLLVTHSIVACGGDDAGPAAPDAGPAIDLDLPIEPRHQALAAALDAERARLGAPGVAALVFEDGQVTFAHGFGVKGLGSSEPVTSATAFRIGSVNKMLTAAVLLQLVEPGKLDQPITGLLPDFALAGDPAWAPSIRVEHLLTHASGLVDYLEIDAAAGDQDDDALGRFMTGDGPGDFEQAAYLMAPSGRMYNYSNPNYYLAGLIAERLDGRPYRETMRARLFAPLEMDHTVFLGAEAIASGDVAAGATYGAGGGQVAVAPDAYDNPWARPAGYAFSTVHDLFRFVRFLAEGDDEVLATAARLAMQAPQVNTHELLERVHYGYGLQLQDGLPLADGYHAARMVAHGGDIPGYAATVAWVPETGFGFITLANADGAHFNDSLALALETLAGLPAPVAPPDEGIDPLSFPRYAGTYQDDFNVGTISVTTFGSGVDRTVSVSMPDVDAAGVPYEPVLVPLSPDNFVLRIQGTQILVTFLEGDAGEIEYLRTRAFVGRREAAPLGRRHPVDGARLREAIRRAAPGAPLVARPVVAR